MADELIDAELYQYFIACKAFRAAKRVRHADAFRAGVMRDAREELLTHSIYTESAPLRAACHRAIDDLDSVVFSDDMRRKEA